MNPHFPHFPHLSYCTRLAGLGVGSVGSVGCFSVYTVYIGRQFVKILPNIWLFQIIIVPLHLRVEKTQKCTDLVILETEEHAI